MIENAKMTLGTNHFSFVRRACFLRVLLRGKGFTSTNGFISLIIANNRTKNRHGFFVSYLTFGFEKTLKILLVILYLLGSLDRFQTFLSNPFQLR